jgi:hypothetical protein
VVAGHQTRIAATWSNGPPPHVSDKRISGTPRERAPATYSGIGGPGRSALVIHALAIDEREKDPRYEAAVRHDRHNGRI